MDMEKSIVTINTALKKALGTKAPSVNDDVLQLGGTLAKQLNHYKPHWSNPVAGLVVAYQLC